MFFPFHKKRGFQAYLLHKTFSGIFPEALSYPSPHLKDKERLQKCTILRLTIQPILIEPSRPDGLHDHSFPAQGNRTYGDQRVAFPPQRRPQTGASAASDAEVTQTGAAGRPQQRRGPWVRGDRRGGRPSAEGRGGVGAPR